MEKLIFGHSPDPDDAFMFYGFAKGKVSIEGYEIEHLLEDIESLNQRALRAELPITAISAFTFPFVSENYWVMKTGASMGDNYGPLVVGREQQSIDSLKGKRIAIPGEKTSAYLLFRLFFPDEFQPVVIPFDRIIESVRKGEVDAGIVIHEGQLTYEKEGVVKLMDLGEEWYQETDGLPVPLGLDVVRKDLGEDLASRISKALQESIEWAYRELDQAIEYALEFGRGLDRNLGEQFVKMYVNDLTKDMGERGKQALETFYRKAYERGLIPSLADVKLI